MQPEDIHKAEATLSSLPDEMLHLEMRKSEKKMILAELLRLKGQEHLALPVYVELITEATEKNFLNLKSIAENRVHIINAEKAKQEEVEELLKDLP